MYYNRNIKRLGACSECGRHNCVSLHLLLLFVASFSSVFIKVLWVGHSMWTLIDRQVEDWPGANPQKDLTMISMIDLGFFFGAACPVMRRLYCRMSVVLRLT